MKRPGGRSRLGRAGTETPLNRRDIQATTFRWLQQELTLTTRGSWQLHDVTSEVEAFVSEFSVGCGLLVLHSMHTTAGLLITEVESGLKEDFAVLADRLVPAAGSYQHDDLSVRWENIEDGVEEPRNGHSHLQHALFAMPSVMLPVRDDTVVMGRWQRIVLVEFDRPRERRVLMQLLGAAGLPFEAETNGAGETARGSTAARNGIVPHFHPPA